MTAVEGPRDDSQPHAVAARKKNNPWFETDIVWHIVIVVGVFHVLALYATPLFVCFRVKWQTWLFCVLCYHFAMIGTVAGSHRLFSHKAFKAAMPLKIFLMLGNSMTGEPCIWRWARDHRVHHKYSDTMADPYSSTRGFFFSHVGWVLLKKHPALIEKRKTIDMSDLNNESVLMFQKRHASKLFILMGLMVPVVVPFYGWNETFLNSLLVCGIFRMVVGWNLTSLVNSWCHFYGTKPYDRTMHPTQTAFVSWVTLGEGWHNYHHAFPSDYRTSELGIQYNPVTRFIDVCAHLGLAWDLKVVSDALVQARIARTGDKTLASFTN